MSDADFRERLLDALRTDTEVRQAVVEIVTLTSEAGGVPLMVLPERVKRQMLDAVADARNRGGSFTARMGR